MALWIFHVGHENRVDGQKTGTTQIRWFSRSLNMDRPIWCLGKRNSKVYQLQSSCILGNTLGYIPLLSTSHHKDHCMFDLNFICHYYLAGGTPSKISTRESILFHKHFPVYADSRDVDGRREADNVLAGDVPKLTNFLVWWGVLWPLVCLEKALLYITKLFLGGGVR